MMRSYEGLLAEAVTADVTGWALAGSTVAMRRL